MFAWNEVKNLCEAKFILLHSHSVNTEPYKDVCTLGDAFFQKTLTALHVKMSRTVIGHLRKLVGRAQ